MNNPKALSVATINNPLMIVLSHFTSPLANFFIYLKVKPSTITTFSCIVASLSLYILYTKDWPIVFSLLWIFALILDIADGLVARRTGQSSALGSFYDHFSDKIKIFLLFFVTAFKYENSIVWVLAWLASDFFLLMSVANEGLAYRSYRLEQGMLKTGSAITDNNSALGQKKTLMRKIKEFLKKSFPFYRYFQAPYNSLMMVQGNSMALIVPLAFGPKPAIIMLSWFSFICFKSLFFIVRAQMTINRALDEAKISWK